MNLQLLATCYLRNNQAYVAYHILKGLLELFCLRLNVELDEIFLHAFNN